MECLHRIQKTQQKLPVITTFQSNIVNNYLCYKRNMSKTNSDEENIDMNVLINKCSIEITTWNISRI